MVPFSDNTPRIQSEETAGEELNEKAYKIRSQLEYCISLIMPKKETKKICSSLVSFLFNLEMAWTKLWLIPYLAINSPRGRNVSHFDDVSALRSEGQVSASVTDIRGPQHCGEMSAQLAPSPCDEAWIDVHGGQT